MTGTTDNIRFVLVDWGTSNYRLWGVSADGEVLCSDTAQSGMAQLKPAEFEIVLEQSLSKHAISVAIPVLICGMAGAAQGWKDAGYLEAPLNMEEAAISPVTVPTKSGRVVRIVPGIKQTTSETPNVMRGEETLLIGAIEQGFRHSIFCLPGTHSKWAFFNQQRLVEFYTVMTGEMFALLSEHSTLSHYLAAKTDVEIDQSTFKSALRQTLARPLEVAVNLFTLRAGPLLEGDSNLAVQRAILSGMLIGLELAAIRDKVSQSIGLIASGAVAKTYSNAFDIAGIEHELIDAERLAISGLFSLARRIWNDDEG